MNHWIEVTGGKILQLGAMPSVKRTEGQDFEDLTAGWVEYEDGSAVYMDYEDHGRLYFRVGETIYTKREGGGADEAYDEMDRILDIYR